MSRFQLFVTSFKKPRFILGLILAIFFLKGLVLGSASPIFNGFDEVRHYNTIQYLAEPEKKDWTINRNVRPSKGDSVQRFNHTPEIKETGKRIRCIGGEDSGCAIDQNVFFSRSFNGTNEAEIDQRNWSRVNSDYPADIVNGQWFYHRLSSIIERVLGNQSILVRFYSIRIFSTLLGTLAIFGAYLLLKGAGFSIRHSLLLTAIISFHPKLSIYYSFITYDSLLILSFFVFTWSGLQAIQKGLDRKNFLIMSFAVILGVLAKGTGLVLAGILIFIIAFHFYQKYPENRILRRLIPILAVLAALTLFLALKKHFIPNITLTEVPGSVSEFIRNTLTIKKLNLSAKNYWNRNENIIDSIWFIQGLAAIGLAWLTFSRKKPPFLPGKKALFFLAGMILALQILIRAVDWRYFASRGIFIVQAPGRYFFPNLAAHFILVFSGLGMLVRKEKYFDLVLKISLVAMFLFFLYSLFNNILLEYYL